MRVQVCRGVLLSQNDLCLGAPPNFPALSRPPGGRRALVKGEKACRQFEGWIPAHGLEGFRRSYLFLFRGRSFYFPSGYSEGPRADYFQAPDRAQFQQTGGRDRQANRWFVKSQRVDLCGRLSDQGPPLFLQERNRPVDY